MDEQDSVKESTAVAARDAMLPDPTGAPKGYWSAWQKLCDERGTVRLRLGFDDDSHPYLYIEETGQIVINSPPHFDVKINNGAGFETVTVTQTLHTDKRVKG